MAVPMCLKDLPEQCSLSLIQNQPGPLLVREFTEKKYTELLDNTGGRQTDISRLRVLNRGCHSNLGDTLFPLPRGFKACAAMRSVHSVIGTGEETIEHRTNSTKLYWRRVRRGRS